MKTLDSRNLNERLEELQTSFNEWKECLTVEQIAEIKEKLQIPSGENLTDEELGYEWDFSDYEELKNLLDLREQFGREWFHGVELIREQDFEEYAQNYAERIGAIDRDGGWPACHIDWEAAANSLMMDYSSVDYDGETYYYRE
jgi:hypothetical protein